jgi:hypothetical protein
VIEDRDLLPALQGAQDFAHLVPQIHNRGVHIILPLGDKQQLIIACLLNPNMSHNGIHFRYCQTQFAHAVALLPLVFVRAL